MAGLSSSFVYGSSDFIDALTTPYGTTTFTKGSSDWYTHLWFEITDPVGERERLDFYDNAGVVSREPPERIPEGILVDNYWLYAYNSFYRNKQAMREAPDDLAKADVTHWMSMADNVYILSGIKSAQRKPLENWLWYEYPDQQVGSYQLMQAGSSDQPIKVARVLDDGSTQLQQFERNAIGKPTKTVDPLGRTTQFVYATNEIDLLEIRQQIGTNAENTELIAQFAYNDQHLPLTVVDAAGQTNAFGYNPYGQLTALTNALGETVTLNYDTNGYLTNITGALPGATTDFTYDDCGRVRTVTDSDGYTVTTEYDALDRPTRVTYPDGTYEEIVYDKLDPVLARDRRGLWTAMVYDSSRRLTAVQDALGRVTRFGWCGCGSLESITDPLGRVTTWLRDLRGRPTLKEYPDSSFVSYAYEAGTSRLKSVTDAKGQTTVYDYFKDDALQQVRFTNAVVATPAVSYTYDTNYARLLTMTDGIGTTAYSYHAVTNTQLGAGQLASVDGPLANDTVSYEYDELGRVKRRAIDGVAQAVVYDALGRVTVVTNALGGFTNEYVGVTARIATNHFPNGQQTTFTYYGTNDDLRLQEIRHISTNAQLSAFGYTYDPAGQIAAWTQEPGTGETNVWVSEYDPVDQLLGVTVRSNTVAGAILQRYVYGYDSAGNRTSEQIDTGGDPLTSAVTAASHNNLNQLTAVTGGGPVRFAGSLDELGTVTVDGSEAPLDSRTTNFLGLAELDVGTNVIAVVASDYSDNRRTNQYEVVITNSGVAKTLAYDANGNLTNAVTATTTNRYEWDAADRLIRITQLSTQTPSQLITEFAYDGQGRRVWAVEIEDGTPVSTNRYLWCGTELCEERDQAGGTVNRRFFGQGEQIGGANYFYTRDHLGSIRELTDETGALRARYDYDPWGRRTKVSGDIDATFGFTGHYVHAASGLHLAPYRAYDAETGRWLSRDLIGEIGGLNLYGYVGNSPANGLDPLGLAFGDYWDIGATMDYYEHLQATSESGFARTGAQLANSLLNFFGARNVAELAGLSGQAWGCGDYVAAATWGALDLGLILLNAFTFGRVPPAKNFALQFQSWKSIAQDQFGSRFLPSSVFAGIKHLDALAKADALIAAYGTKAAVRRLTRRAIVTEPLKYLANVRTGPTPLGWVTAFPATVAANTW